MYIGKTPALGNYQKCDAITTSATATYNLVVGGVAVSPETANNCIVSLNGVIQAPTDAYTIVGSTIVFNSALTSADVIDFILVLGDVLDIGTVSDGTITAAKLADTAISGKTALAVAPADTDEFLVSDAGVLKRLDYSLIKGGGKINQVVQTHKSDTASTTSTSLADVTGMSVAITPSAATSKILVVASLSTSAQSGYGGGFELQRDINSGGYATIAQGDAASSNTRGWIGNKGDNGDVMLRPCGVFLDAPTWTSGAITYKLRWFIESGGTAYLNRSYGGGTSATNVTGSSSFLAIEVLA
jgi:hypothetical protein